VQSVSRQLSESRQCLLGGSDDQYIPLINALLTNPLTK